jgi:hypothetical protein
LQPFQLQTVAVSKEYLAFIFVDSTDAVMTLNKTVIECIAVEECTFVSRKRFFSFLLWSAAQREHSLHFRKPKVQHFSGNALHSMLCFSVEMSKGN